MLWAQSATKDYIGANTNFSLSARYSFHKSSYHKSCFLSLHAAGTQRGNLHLAGWPILFHRPTQEPCVSHSQHRKNQERFGKNASEWTGSVEISMEETPGSTCSIYSYVLCTMYTVYYVLCTPGFKGRTFKFCVLTRWDFDFCVRSSPLQGIFPHLWGFGENIQLFIPRCPLFLFFFFF